MTKITAKNFDIEKVSLSQLEKSDPKELAKIIFRLALELQRKNK